MRIYEANDKEDIAEQLTALLEHEAHEKIYTMRILGEKEGALEVLVVFENKQILSGEIKVDAIKGKLACRIQANWI